MSSQPTIKKVGIVAGETSGDHLGASLIQYFKQRYPHIHFVGIGGEAMARAGCEILAPMQLLTSFGLLDVIKKLPRLWQFFHKILHNFVALPIDLYIGIDNPDFNLRMAKAIKKRLAIPTIQYGSPTIWAWRKNRLRMMNRYIDTVLTLFPFEVACYQDSKVNAYFVGHPLADEIPLGGQIDTTKIPPTTANPLIALLPGSRLGEIQHLAKPFLQTIQQCLPHYPHLQCIIPLANETLKEAFLVIKNKIAPDLTVTIIMGNAQAAMAKADLVLLASGTATLEAMLLNKPMVVAYKVAWFNYYLARLLIRTPYIAFPNLLSGEALVPEFFQKEVKSQVLAKTICAILADQTHQTALKKRFIEIHRSMQCQTNESIEQVLHHQFLQRNDPC